MQKPMNDVMRLMTRRTRSGQSIIIIALGFIVLIAFVGIATDAALLFVRFTTLRRSVDAAAVAAAGQIRENSSYAQIAAAAQQYIKLHGLNPEQVLVETCETDIENLKRANPKPPGAPLTEATQLFRDWLSSTNSNGQPNSELCRKDPAKLVRVTAMVDSPTTFLSVIGYPRITLAASSISQTAVMDVVLMIDSSLSMAYDTQQLMFTQGRTTVQKPVVDAYLDGQFPGWHVGAEDSTGFTLGLNPYTNTVNESEFRDGTDDVDRRYYKRTATGLIGKTVRAECRQGDPGNSFGSDTPPNPPPPATNLEPKANGIIRESEGEFLLFANYGWGGCCNDPTTQVWPENVDPTRSDDDVERTYGRFREQSALPDANTNDINWFIDARTGVINVNGGTDAGGLTNKASVTSGAADKNFADLMCRPFKDVRDATRRFLLKVDFTRGDRVIMIQFDSSARPLTPNGILGSSGSVAPIFTSKSSAINALNRYVGVSAAANGFNSSCATFYSSARSWNEFDAQHPFNIPPPNASNQYEISGEPYRQREYFYETIANCTDTNTGAAIQASSSLLSDPRWIRRDAVWIAVLLSDGYPNRTPGIGIKNQYEALGGRGYIDSPAADGVWNPNIHLIPNSLNNIGYGGPTNLSTGTFFDDPLPGALADPGFCPWRTLCDPTAGAANNQLLYAESVTLGGPNITYNSIRGQVTRAENPTDTLASPIDGYYNSQEWWAKYCEISELNPEPIWWDFYRYAENMNVNDTAWHEGGDPLSARRPYCADNNPDTRHFCVNRTTGAIVPGSYDILCSKAYDADDFARDQVDFAALIDYTPTLKGNFIAMFSIFFPHTVQGTTNTVNDTVYLRENILGVKFMRYVADAGDNGIIDNPLQAWYRDQAYKGPYIKDPVPPGSNVNNDKIGWNSANLPADYKKTKDPCFDYDFREQGKLPFWSSVEGGNNQANREYEELAQKNCGNYYYAGNSTSIDRAFTDIASRLFTRLSR
jgi:hypothetical protein